MQQHLNLIVRGSLAKSHKQKEVLPAEHTQSLVLQSEQYPSVAQTEMHKSTIGSIRLQNAVLFSAMQ